MGSARACANGLPTTFGTLRPPGSASTRTTAEARASTNNFQSSTRTVGVARACSYGLPTAFGLRPATFALTTPFTPRSRRTPAWATAPWTPATPRRGARNPRLSPNLRSPNFDTGSGGQPEGALSRPGRIRAVTTRPATGPSTTKRTTRLAHLGSGRGPRGSREVRRAPRLGAAAAGDRSGAEDRHRDLPTAELVAAADAAAAEARAERAGRAGRPGQAAA